MITETKKIYKCEFCRKLYQRKWLAGKHEKKCSRNPDNDRACFHCKYLTKKKVDVYFERYSESGMYEVYFCEKLNIYLYPPKAENKGNKFEIDDDSENLPMKKVCIHSGISYVNLDLISDIEPF